MDSELFAWRRAVGVEGGGTGWIRAWPFAKG